MPGLEVTTEIQQDLKRLDQAQIQGLLGQINKTPRISSLVDIEEEKKNPDSPYYKALAQLVAEFLTKEIVNQQLLLSHFNQLKIEADKDKSVTQPSSLAPDFQRLEKQVAAAAAIAKPEDRKQIQEISAIIKTTSAEISQIEKEIDQEIVKKDKIFEEISDTIVKLDITNKIIHHEHTNAIEQIKAYGQMNEAIHTFQPRAIAADENKATTQPNWSEIMGTKTFNPSFFKKVTDIAPQFQQQLNKTIAVKQKEQAESEDKILKSKRALASKVKELSRQEDLLNRITSTSFMPGKTLVTLEVDNNQIRDLLHLILQQHKSEFTSALSH